MESCRAYVIQATLRPQTLRIHSRQEEHGTSQLNSCMLGLGETWFWWMLSKRLGQHTYQIP